MHKSDAHWHPHPDRQWQTDACSLLLHADACNIHWVFSTSSASSGSSDWLNCAAERMHRHHTHNSLIPPFCLWPWLVSAWQHSTSSLLLYGSQSNTSHDPGEAAITNQQWGSVSASVCACVSVGWYAVLDTNIPMSCWAETFDLRLSDLFFRVLMFCSLLYFPYSSRPCPPFTPSGDIFQILFCTS